MHRFIIPLFALAALLVSCSRFMPGGTPPPAPVPPPAAAPTAAQFKWDGQVLAGVHTVVLHTTKGDLTLELNADAAPKSVTNFVTLAKNGFFDNLTFHRVIPGFMIQGGDPKGDGTGGTSIFGETFEDEINARSYSLHGKIIKNLDTDASVPPEIASLTIMQYYEKQGYKFNDQLRSLPVRRGSVMMANRGPNTNGSQFFIVQAEKAPWLEGKHTVFGTVSSGMDVVDAIAQVPRDSLDKPTTPVTFTVEIK